MFKEHDNKEVITNPCSDTSLEHINYLNARIEALEGRIKELEG